MSNDRDTEYFRNMPNAKYKQGDLDWATAIMTWWQDAQYMTSGEHGDRNVFDDEPDFVTKAKDVLAFWEDPRVSAIADLGIGRCTANILFRKRVRTGERQTVAQMLADIRENAHDEHAYDLPATVLKNFLVELEQAEAFDLSALEAKYKLHLETCRG